MTEASGQSDSPHDGGPPNAEANAGSSVDDDSTLMQQIAAGDEQAFEAIYDRHSARLFALCLRIVGNRTEAQSVLSDVFLELWRRADQFDTERGSPRAYLTTLTRSRSIDRLRSNAGRVAREQEACRIQETRVRYDEGEPSHQVMTGEHRQLVKKAMESLSDAQQSALNLAYFDGLSHRQIAQRLDTPLGSIKTHIRQGLLKLRRSLSSLDDS